MHRSMITLAVIALSILTAQAQSAPPGEAQLEAINRQFKDRMITAKMDLPIVRSVYVRPDGEYDEQRYRDRLESQPPSIPRDDTAKLTKIEVDGDKVNVNINGGGMPKPRGKVMAIIGGRKRRGSRIEIEFGRPVTAADLTPEMIVRAVSRIISIDGMEASVALARPDELLGAIAAATPPAQPSSKPADAVPAALPETRGTVKAATPGRAIIEVLSAEVKPTRLRAGEKLELIVHYEVQGLSNDTRATVIEERHLIFDGKPLLSKPLSTSAARANGRHNSALDFNVPAGATPGIYTFRVGVRVDDVTATKEALFEIVP